MEPGPGSSEAASLTRLAPGWDDVKAELVRDAGWCARLWLRCVASPPSAWWPQRRSPSTGVPAAWPPATKLGSQGHLVPPPQALPDSRPGCGPTCLSPVDGPAWARNPGESRALGAKASPVEPLGHPQPSGALCPIFKSLGKPGERLAPALTAALCPSAVVLCHTPAWPRLPPSEQAPWNDPIVSLLLSFSGISVVW